jgi:tRNA-splicing ligase RtcB (3'-phosphate/5'-hydroxy nucleic acid ligase)
MDPARFTRVDPTTWRIEPTGPMHVPAIIYADQDLIRDMDDKVYEQAVNVAMLPGIVQASYAMPDAHWGYGFPIGGVAAFDPDQGGVISAGGVGFDISCGVRTMLTGLQVADILPVQSALAHSLYREIPAGVGSKGAITLDPADMDAMLSDGARWAIERGWGEARDLERIEEQGCTAGARPECVSDRAKERQRREMGTLGSGNHYLEIQAVAQIYDPAVAQAFGLALDDVVATIHCGSRGLGHQIGTEFLKEMVVTAESAGITLPDRELAWRRSTPRLASAISAPCGQPSIVRWQTAKSSVTIPAACSRISFRTATCAFCSTSPITPARSRHTRSTEHGATCSFTAKALRAHLGRLTNRCRPRCAAPASRC